MHHTTYEYDLGTSKYLFQFLLVELHRYLLISIHAFDVQTYFLIGLNIKIVTF